MNRKVFSLVLVALSFLTLHSAALAQSDLHVRVNVPFAFTLENKTFAAGTYDILQLEPAVLSIRNADRSIAAVLRVTESRSEVAASVSPSLVFHRYGEKYFLAQITSAGSARAMAVPSGNQEQELARAKTSRDLITVLWTNPRAGSK